MSYSLNVQCAIELTVNEFTTQTENGKSVFYLEILLRSLALTHVPKIILQLKIKKKIIILLQWQCRYDAHYRNDCLTPISISVRSKVRHDYRSRMDVNVTKNSLTFGRDCDQQ